MTVHRSKVLTALLISLPFSAASGYWAGKVVGESGGDLVVGSVIAGLSGMLVFFVVRVGVEVWSHRRGEGR